MYEMFKLAFRQETTSRTQTLYSFSNFENVVTVNDAEYAGYPLTCKVDENV
jgi:hypothetical protein